MTVMYVLILTLYFCISDKYIHILDTCLIAIFYVLLVRDYSQPHVTAIQITY